MNRLPRRQQRQRGQEAGQHNQEQADAVHPQVVRDAELRQPGPVLDELEVGVRGVEAPPEKQRRRERDERDGQRRHADDALAVGAIAAAARQEDQHRADQRQKDDG
jgi:hypothetical protein